MPLFLLQRCVNPFLADHSDRYLWFFSDSYYEQNKLGSCFYYPFFVFIFLGICAILVCILPSQFLAHAKSIVQFRQFLTSEKVLSERILCWKASIAMIKEHPVLGIGPGSRAFRYAYQQYGQEIRNREGQQVRGDVPAQSEKKKGKKKSRIKKVERLSHAHNIFLYITAGSGIVGLLSFLWLFAVVFYEAVKAWKSSPVNYTKMLLLGITASLISLFLHGLTDIFWKIPDALFLWYIIGILFVIICNQACHGYSAQHK